MTANIFKKITRFVYPEGNASSCEAENNTEYLTRMFDEYQYSALPIL